MLLLLVLVLATQGSSYFRRLVLVLRIYNSKLNFKVACSLLRRLQSLAYLLIPYPRFPSPGITSVSLLRNTIRLRQVHLLICELSLPHHHWCFTWFFRNIFASLLLLLRVSTSIKLIGNSSHGIGWIICIWIQIEFGRLMF